MLFPGRPHVHFQSYQIIHAFVFVTSRRLRTINLIPIDYDFRPHLRGRLTLLGKPRTGNLGLSAGVFLALLYVTHVSILTSDTSSCLLRQPSPAYGTFRYHL